ncbi:DoxX family protein [Allokutzneria oryzae]|uniref:DoxX family protein n=1 Tax=Allokutzneria oryzae TaxID=1378989 RepID=A0ABV6A2M7_9PSEU
MGVLHFVKPEPFDAIVPRQLPGAARTWTHLSGVAELGCAAAVAVPRTRRLGGLLTAGLFVGVFPANVKMALDYRRKPAKQRLVALARLPLQVPLVLWALRVRDKAPR